MLAALGLPAWAQVGDGPVAPMTAPPSINSPASPSVAVGVPRAAPLPVFAAASVPSAVRMTPESREERNFLRNAAAESRFELEASRLAFAKSNNAALRALAASLINHNNTIGLELAHLLYSRGMAMPMLGNEQGKALRKMRKLSSGKFDSAYMQQVGLAQAALARDYEKAGATIREPQLNAWIVKTLGNVRYHQDMAERAVHADPRHARLTRVARPLARAPVAQVQPVTSSAAAGRLSASNSQ